MNWVKFAPKELPVFYDVFIKVNLIFKWKKKEKLLPK